MADHLIFGLSERIRADLRDVFQHYPNIGWVLIFGSRAKGSERAGSDIDLAVIAPQMTDAEFAQLWNDIDVLPIVFKIDLLHWDRLANQPLKDKILREGCLFYGRTGNGPAFSQPGLDCQSASRPKQGARPWAKSG